MGGSGRGGSGRSGSVRAGNEARPTEVDVMKFQLFFFLDDGQSEQEQFLFQVQESENLKFENFRIYSDLRISLRDAMVSHASTNRRVDIRYLHGDGIDDIDGSTSDSAVYPRYWELNKNKYRCSHRNGERH